MSDQQNKAQSGAPDYGSSSGFSGSVPQSGMVRDEDKDDKHPPTGNGVENGSTPTRTAREVKDDDEQTDR